MAEVTQQMSPRHPKGGEGKGEGGKVVAFIGLGSNVGERRQNILNAVDELNHMPGTCVLQLSTLIETKPIGPIQEQPDFLNAVVAVNTSLHPIELLEKLLLIEAHLGRVREERWGPRIIDLDILFFGDQKIDSQNLIIPHPEIKNRPFIQEALVELQSRGLSPHPHPHPLPQGERG